jgi:hypothetical protein
MGGIGFALYMRTPGMGCGVIVADSSFTWKKPSKQFNKGGNMQPDPFGNLKDWGPVLELVCQLADTKMLSECQPGLTRILAYKDNWRLREEALKRLGAVDNPSQPLLDQVFRIIANDNLYYEVRILACQAMAEVLKNMANRFTADTRAGLAEILSRQLATPQPPIFADALKGLDAIVHERFGRP